MPETTDIIYIEGGVQMSESSFTDIFADPVPTDYEFPEW